MHFKLIKTFHEHFRFFNCWSLLLVFEIERVL